VARGGIHHRFSLASAREAAGDGRLAQWVGDFLASPGSNNAVLAAALAQRRHRWFGPVQVPVDELVRLAGSEDDALVTVDEEVWDDDVAGMEDGLDRGWEPPPLLAEWRHAELLLQDGNHRFDALVRAGASAVWVVVYSDDPFATLDDRLRTT
jgi:hypothetical protein